MSAACPIKDLLPPSERAAARQRTPAHASYRQADAKSSPIVADVPREPLVCPCQGRPWARVPCRWLISTRQVAVEEGARAQDLDAALAGHIEEVRVSAHDDAGTTREGTRQELVVVGVGADLGLEHRGWERLRVHQHQVEGHREIDPGELLLEFGSDTTVFLVNVGGEHEFESALAPRQEDLVRWLCLGSEGGARRPIAGVTSTGERQACGNRSTASYHLDLLRTHVVLALARQPELFRQQVEALPRGR